LNSYIFFFRHSTSTRWGDTYWPSSNEFDLSVVMLSQAKNFVSFVYRL